MLYNLRLFLRQKTRFWFLTSHNILICKFWYDQKTRFANLKILAFAVWLCKFFIFFGMLAHFLCVHSKKYKILSHCIPKGEFYGSVAQLVEHYLDMVGVVGSSPIRATITTFSHFSISRFFKHNQQSKQIIIHKQKTIILIGVLIVCVGKRYNRDFG